MENVYKKYDNISNFVEDRNILDNIINETFKDNSLTHLDSIIEKSEVIKVDSSECEVIGEEEYKKNILKNYNMLFHSFIEWSIRDQRTISTDLIDLIDEWIETIDEMLSIQLSEILHNKEFKELESSYRGLYYLVTNTKDHPLLKIKVLSVSKSEIYKDMKDAKNVHDASQLYKKIYSFGIGSLDEEPYGAIIGDYEFSKSSYDISLLKFISGISSVSYAPFISGASPELLGWKDFTVINDPTSLANIFQSCVYDDWNKFRKTEDSRYVSLVLPHLLMRRPYGAGDFNEKVEDFNFNEFNSEENIEELHSKFLWGNAAYALGVNITSSFFNTGWFLQMIGMKNGGDLKNTINYKYESEDGLIPIYSSECRIPENRGKEFSHLGLIPILNRSTSGATFLSLQTLNFPKNYTDPKARESAILSSWLHRILCVSRFCIYLKWLLRGKIGGFASESRINNELNTWISQYVLMNADEADEEDLSKYPLSNKFLSVKKVRGKPGVYDIILKLQFHDQLQEVSVSVRMVPQDYS